MDTNSDLSRATDLELLERAVVEQETRQAAFPTVAAAPDPRVLR